MTMPSTVLEGVAADLGRPVLDVLREKLAALIEIDATELDPDLPLINLGADSIILMEAITYLEDAYGVEIRVSQLVEELSTLALLAAHLEAVGRHAPERIVAPDDPPAPPPAPVDDPAGSVTATVRGAPPADAAAVRDPAPAPEPRSADPASSEQATTFSAWMGPPSAPSAGATDAPGQDLIDTFSRRLAASKAHADRFRGTHADPRSVASLRRATKEVVVPVVASRAEGAVVVDLDGRDLLDMSMGFGSVLFGHGHAPIRAAVAHQLDAVSSVGAVSYLAGPLSEEVVALTGHDRASFVTTGTEAIMLAVRLARAATGRRRVAIFRGAYHGWWDGTLSLPGPGSSPGSAVAATSGIVGSPAEDLLVLPWDDPTSLEVLAEHGAELAAVVAEPVQSRRPGCHCPGFLRSVQELTASSGSVLVFDEMITGFRIAAGGAAERFGIRPDLATFGKALGGGMPIGCVAGRADLLDLLDGGPWRYGDGSVPQVPSTFGAGTFAKHPLSMAAAWAFVTEVRALGDALYDQLEQRSATLQAETDAVFRRWSIPARLERCGSMMRVMSRWNLDAFFAALIAEGIYVWEGRTMFLSTAHGEAEIQRFVDACDRACRVVIGTSRPSTAAMPGPVDDARRPDGDRSGEEPVIELPLTPNQTQLSFAYRSGSEVAEGFHNVAVVSLDGPLDVDAASSAIDEIVRRHDSMRTTFDLERGVEILHRSTTLRLESTSVLDAGAGERAVQEQVSEACTTPFDLESGPLWRVRLIRSSTTSAKLVVVCSDLVADGWSLALILREFVALYDAAAAGRPAVLDAPPRLELLRGWLSSPDAAARLDAGQRFWDEVLTDVDLASPLPPTTTGAFDSFVKARALRTIGSVTMEQARSAASAAGATSVSSLLGTFAALVHRVGGRRDFLIGIPTNGRPDPALRTLVASMATPVAIRFRVEPQQPLGELWRDTQSAVFRALDQPVPIDLLARRHAQRTGILAPVTPVMFNFDPIADVPVLAGGVTMRIGMPERTFGLVPFSADLCPASEGDVSLAFDASEHMYDRAMVECWADYYVDLVRTLPHLAGDAVGRLPLRGSDG